MFVIGYLGRFLIDKGIQDLLVLARCLQFYKDIEIHIAGSETKRAGSAERLVIHELMQLSSVKIFPNLSGQAKKNFIENIPTSDHHGPNQKFSEGHGLSEGGAIPTSLDDLLESNSPIEPKGISKVSSIERFGG